MPPLSADTSVVSSVPAPGRSGGGRRGLLGPWRAPLLVLSVLGLLLCVLLSFRIGVAPVSTAQVWHAFTHYHHTVSDIIVRKLREPRTFVAVGAGASLAVAGALMQALTRNPLADPGILGINAGAALTVVLTLFVIGATSPNAYVWAAFPGALAGALLVYALASAGRDGATPMKLVLAGAIVSSFAGSIIGIVVFLNGAAQLQLRMWSVGTVTGQDMATVRSVAPMMIVGLVLAVASARALNVLSLGDDAARSLGMRIVLVRSVVVLAVVLLAGSAVAEAGPIAFVGLAVPNAARAMVGPDYRWIIAFSAVLGPVMVLVADILGRVVLRPEEVPTGIMIALVGAPVFLLLARRKRLAQL
jgi:iron complex transport system permease protein